MLSFLIVCICTDFIFLLLKYKTPENISDMKATATAHTGEALAKQKIHFHFLVENVHWFENKPEI